jgi:hypothetical protein
MKITPVRLQRKRTKGFKLESPNGLPIRYCGRKTPYGSPYKIECQDGKWYVLRNGFTLEGPFRHKKQAHTASVKLFRKNILPDLLATHDLKKELGGMNLSCWCSMDFPCHCNELLLEAND